MGMLVAPLDDENGPKVITEAVTRECIQVEGDPDTADEKRQTMKFKDITHLAFSFRNIRHISNLQGLHNLVRLQLDNNYITKIENLGHLVKLQWLDLSFNAITQIEGLESLTSLEDLSLFSNRITHIDGLHKLTGLKVLSLGNNAIASFDSIASLRQLRLLRALSLSGNPLARDPDYRPYLLSHVRGLTYLDYRRVLPADVAAAVEQHQDDMLELQEREEAEAEHDAAEAEAAAHAALMDEANLGGVETLLEDIVRADAEWPKLTAVPGITDGWADVKEKFTQAVEEFKTTILEHHEAKKTEYAEWWKAVTQFMGEQDARARAAVTAFDKLKKHVFRSIRESPADAETLLEVPQARNRALQGELMGIELETSESLAELLAAFDRNYTEIAEHNRTYYNQFFSTVRELDNHFFENCSIAALAALEKFASENTDVDAFPEDARIVLSDKDALLNSIQASHDVHTTRIDLLEDRLIQQELKRANELGAEKAQWLRQRNRDRIAEVIGNARRNARDMDEVLHDEEPDH